MSKYVDNNPKTLAGANRLPLHLVPPSATAFLAEAMADGGRKYGPYNWRTSPISVSPYYAAAKRHLDAFWDGEEVAGDSGVHHLAHAMACCAIVLDALTLDVLVDDRPPKGKAADLQAAYANKHKEVVKDAPKQGELRLIDGYAADGSGRKVRIWDPAFAPGYVNLPPAYPLESGRVPDDEADVRPEAGRE